MGGRVRGEKRGGRQRKTEREIEGEDERGTEGRREKRQRRELEAASVVGVRGGENRTFGGGRKGAKKKRIRAEETGGKNRPVSGKEKRGWVESSGWKNRNGGGGRSNEHA